MPYFKGTLNPEEENYERERIQNKSWLKDLKSPNTSVLNSARYQESYIFFCDPGTQSKLEQGYKQVVNTP